MGKEYNRFIYQDENFTIYIMALVLLLLMIIRRIVINRKIIHRKEIVMVLLIIFFLYGTCGFVLLNVIGIIHTEFLVSLSLVFWGLGGIGCRYLIKYQEEFAKMGRKEIFISTMSSKEVFVMSGLVISLGVFLVILIHVF